MGDIGPCPRGGDPVAKLTDVALQIVKLGDFAGDPVGRQMAAAFGQVAVHARHDTRMRLRARLPVIWKAAYVPQPPDRRRSVRSEERRVGKECVSRCRSRWSPFHENKNST